MRVQLRTLVVCTWVAGGVLWLNLMQRPVPTSDRFDDDKCVLRIETDAAGIEWHEGLDTQSAWGWPLTIRRQTNTEWWTYPDSEFVLPAKMKVVPTLHDLKHRAVFVNGLLGLAFIVIIGFGMERCFKRR